MSETRIAIIMPTINEAANIEDMIDTLFATVPSAPSGIQMMLVIVDGNSSDGTDRIVQQKCALRQNIHFLRCTKKGLGHAYLTGFKYAMETLHAEAVLQMDADFQHDPQYIVEMIRLFMQGTDYVIGSRYTSGGSLAKDWRLHRRLISHLGNRLAQYLLRMPENRDFTSGFRLTRVKGILDKIDLDSLMALDHFAYKIDLFYRTTRLSSTVHEIPIHFSQRKKEKTKFRFREIIYSLKVVMQLRLRQREESA